MSAIIFVREKSTLKFVASDGHWLTSFSKSKAFRSTWEAADFCLKKEIHHADIVMRMGPERCVAAIDVL